MKLQIHVVHVLHIFLEILQIIFAKSVILNVKNATELMLMIVYNAILLIILIVHLKIFAVIMHAILVQDTQMILA